MAKTKVAVTASDSGQTGPVPKVSRCGAFLRRPA